MTGSVKEGLLRRRGGQPGGRLPIRAGAGERGPGSRRPGRGDLLGLLVRQARRHQREWAVSESLLPPRWPLTWVIWLSLKHQLGMCS